MAPTKPRSRKKGREPRTEVMTIMPPLRRPGHVSIAKYGVTNGAQVHYSQDTAPSALSQGCTGLPGGWWLPVPGMEWGPSSMTVSPQC